MSEKPYLLYGSELSYYTGKVRSYLIHKNIPYIERSPSAREYLAVFKRKVGAAAVPVMVTPEGEWWGDSSNIIDRLEQRFTVIPCLPNTPILRFAAYLFELWGDEFVLPLAMYTRWGRPEHLPAFVAQVGTGMMPGWPKFVQNYVGRKIARMMSSFRPVLGFDEAQYEILHHWGVIQLDALDRHFAQSPFLFGSRPCLGDYGLIGPLYAHLGRDALSKRDWIDTRPALGAWIKRMRAPETAVGGTYFTADQLPDTLNTAVQSIFTEMLPFLLACREAVLAVPADTTPRVLGKIHYPMAGQQHTRHALSYPLWMVNRLMHALAQESAENQAKVQAWASEHGGEKLFTTVWPKMQRHGTQAVRKE